MFHVVLFYPRTAGSGARRGKGERTGPFAISMQHVAVLPARFFGCQLLGFIGAPVVGGLIASQRPANVYGWLWLALGMSLALMQFGQTYATCGLVGEPRSLPAPRTVWLRPDTSFRESARRLTAL